MSFEDPETCSSRSQACEIKMRKVVYLHMSRKFRVGSIVKEVVRKVLMKECELFHIERTRRGHEGIIMVSVVR